MKLTLTVVSFWCFLISWSAMAEPAWTLATPWPKGSYEAGRAKAIAGELAAATGTKLRVKTSAEHGLPGDRLFQATRAGLVPLSEWVLDQAATAEPILAFNNLPTPVKDFSAAEKEFRKRRAIIAKAMDRQGLELLLLTPWEPPGLFTQRAPTSLDAVAGYRVKVYDRFGTEFIRKLGGEPKRLGFRALKEAFKKGRINAVLTSPSMALAGKVHNRTMYFTELKLALPFNAIVIGKAFLHQLSPDQRQTLRSKSKTVERVVWQKMKKRYQRSLDVLQARGMMMASEMPEWLEHATQTIATEMQQSFLAGLTPEDAKQLHEAH